MVMCEGVQRSYTSLSAFGMLVKKVAHPRLQSVVFKSWSRFSLLVTHPLLRPLSGTTQVSRYQEGKTNLDFTGARDSEWQCHYLGHCKSAHRSRQITTPAPHTAQFFYSPYALPATQPTVSKHWRNHQPPGDVSHKPSGRLPLPSARPAVTLATLKRAATNFVAWWTDAWWVWTVCLWLLPDSIAAEIWAQALLRLSPAC